MKEINVSRNEAGQRLDKLLKKYLPKAPGSFYYKMLRKKNIVLNGKKAQGNEILISGDCIKLFLSDETIEKFSFTKTFSLGEPSLAPGNSNYISSLTKDEIIYEDEHILLMNKPAGILSQKATVDDISMVERMIHYLQVSGQITKEQLKLFRPSVCNRLDRNTSGLIIAGKTLPALQSLSKALSLRTLHKFYHTVTAGVLEQEYCIEGFLYKDHQKNQVKIRKTLDHYEQSRTADWQPIKTRYLPLDSDERCTLLEVELLTGRTHQIRAHLASSGHPVIGDGKYGDRKINNYYKELYGLQHHLLHSCRLELPEIEGELHYLSGRVFEAEAPGIFKQIVNDIQAKKNIEYKDHDKI